MRFRLLAQTPALPKESVEYVYNQLENAVTDLADDETKAEWDNLKSESGIVSFGCITVFSICFNLFSADRILIAITR